MKILEFNTIKNETLFSKTQAILEQDGVLVLRGMKLDQLLFESLTKKFSNTFYKVSSRNLDREIVGDGFTTQVDKLTVGLFGHSESHYAPLPLQPDLGFLFCAIEPEKDDESTFVINAIEMFDNLPQGLQDRFKNENIVYEFLWEPKRWKTQFLVSSEKELIELFKTSKNVKYTIKNGLLHMFYTLSAIYKYKNGKIAFSNGILSHLPNINHKSYKKDTLYLKETNQVYWENGEVFCDKIINQLIDTHDKYKQSHTWEKNDILIFDNIKYLHGRETISKFSKRTLFSRFGYKNSFFVF